MLLSNGRVLSEPPRCFEAHHATVAIGRCFEIQWDSQSLGKGEVTACLAPCPDQFKCPITHRSMVDPVMTADGQVYDRCAIEHWFSKGQRTSPCTQLSLSSLALVPLEPLRSAIQTYLQSRPEIIREHLDCKAYKAAAGQLTQQLVQDAQEKQNTIQNLEEDLCEARAGLNDAANAVAQLRADALDKQRTVQQLEDDLRVVRAKLATAENEPLPLCAETPKKRKRTASAAADASHEKAAARNTALFQKLFEVESSAFAADILVPVSTTTTASSMDSNRQVSSSSSSPKSLFFYDEHAFDVSTTMLGMPGIQPVSCCHDCSQDVFRCNYVRSDTLETFYVSVYSRLRIHVDGSLNFRYKRSKADQKCSQRVRLRFRSNTPHWIAQEHCQKMIEIAPRFDCLETAKAHALKRKRGEESCPQSPAPLCID